MTGDRGWRAPSTRRSSAPECAVGAELVEQGRRAVWYATGRRGVSSLTFRGRELAGSYTGFSDRPAYADARGIADDLIAAYVDGKLDRVDILYNAYVSPLTQHVTRETLLPLSQSTITGEGADAGPAGRSGAVSEHGSAPARWSNTSRVPRRSSSASCPTTSRSRSTVP